MKKVREKVKCPRESCGWTWTPRVEKPVECPKCKFYIKDKAELVAAPAIEAE